MLQLSLMAGLLCSVTLIVKAADGETGGKKTLLIEGTTAGEQVKDSTGPAKAEDSAQNERGGEERETAAMPKAGTDPKPHAQAPTSPRAEIEWLGQRYILGRRQESGNTASDEYFLENESPGNWSQVLAVQKVEGRSPSGVIESMKRMPDLKLEILREDSGSCVLKIEEKGPGMERREGVMLIQHNETPKPGLAVITYLLKPTRVEASKASLQLEAWKERLLAQSRTRNGKT